jgi:hypothetical protein
MKELSYAEKMFLADVGVGQETGGYWRTIVTRGISKRFHVSPYHREQLLKELRGAQKRRSGSKTEASPITLDEVNVVLKQALDMYNVALDGNKGKTFDHLVRTPDAERADALREKFATYGIEIKGTTWRAALKEATAAKKANPKLLFGKTQIEGFRKQGDLRHQAMKNYVQAMNEVMTSTHMDDAKRWVRFYPEASQLLAGIADDEDLTYLMAAALVAATSPSKKWPGKDEKMESVNHNIGVMLKMLGEWRESGELGKPYRNVKGHIVSPPYAKGPYREMFGYHHDLSLIIEKATKALKGEDIFAFEGDIPVVGRKTTNFLRNLMGNDYSVTVDRHMEFLAWHDTGKKFTANVEAVSEPEYTALEAVTRRMGVATNLPPSAVQAILWGFSREVVNPATKGRTKEENILHREHLARRAAAGGFKVYMAEDGNPLEKLFEEMEEMSIDEMLIHFLRLAKKPELEDEVKS